MISRTHWFNPWGPVFNVHLLQLQAVRVSIISRSVFGQEQGQ